MKPTAFVASSKENLAIARAIQNNLEPDVEVTIWNQGIFGLSQFTLESLVAALDQYDFGIFVFGADDIAIIRDKEQRVPRDNVVFELGLFVGRLGKERNFIVRPQNAVDLHLPTDLLGITPATFEPNRRIENMDAALGTACNKILAAIRKLGIRTRDSSSSDELVPIRGPEVSNTSGQANATAYPQLTNPEVREKSLKFVAKLRTAIETAKRKEAELSATRPDKESAVSEEEKRAVEQEYRTYMNKVRVLSNEFEFKYNKVMKVEAKLLRDELLRRLVLATNSREDIDSYYDLGSSSFVAERVAADLEYLARLLPV